MRFIQNLPKSNKKINFANPILSDHIVDDAKPIDSIGHVGIFSRFVYLMDIR